MDHEESQVTEAPYLEEPAPPPGKGWVRVDRYETVRVVTAQEAIMRGYTGPVFVHIECARWVRAKQR